MSKNNKTVDRIQAVWNMIGGDEGADALIEGRSRLEIKKRYIVNLATKPRLPFENAEVVKHESTIGGKTEVELELRDDTLYVDGRKTVLTQMKPQKGCEILEELENREYVLLNSNVLDYICEHPELFPESWKKDENRNTRFIYFWGTILKGSSVVGVCVCSLSWGCGKPYRRYSWLGEGWPGQRWLVSLES